MSGSPWEWVERRHVSSSLSVCPLCPKVGTGGDVVGVVVGDVGADLLLLVQRVISRCAAEVLGDAVAGMRRVRCRLDPCQVHVLQL